MSRCSWNYKKVPVSPILDLKKDKRLTRVVRFLSTLKYYQHGDVPRRGQAQVVEVIGWYKNGDMATKRVTRKQEGDDHSSMDATATTWFS